MKIGIVTTLNPAGGGKYQYALTLLEGLAAVARQDGREDYVLFMRPQDKPFLTSLNAAHWSHVSLPAPPVRNQTTHQPRTWSSGGWLREAWREIRSRVGYHRKTSHSDPERIRLRPEWNYWFRRHGVDWVFYTNAKMLAFEAGLPYVMPVPDIQHRLQPEFPEVSANGEWERREYLFRNGTRYATMILSDSEVGKEDILQFYGPCGVTPDRIKVLPYLPASYLSVDIRETERARVRHAYRLPDRYMFYPAQFWPHKNHARIVQSLDLVKKEGGDEIHFVLSGSFVGEIRERTFHEVMTLARQLGLAHQIHYLGHVPDGDMSGLYAEAVALIMPTFFGPTNIPVVEAWAFGCPVLTSDIRGIREQVGDAGLLVDPRSAEAIADGMQRLWENHALRQEMAERGRLRLARYTPEDFRRRLGDIILEASERVHEGKCPANAV